MNLLEQLKYRYATKSFDSNKKISTEDLSILLESLRLSPSSYGLQPWKFIVVENPALRQQLRPHSWGQSQITDASHLVVLCNVEKMTQELVDKYIHQVSNVRWVSPEQMQGYKDMMMGDVVNWPRWQQSAVWAKNQVYIALWFLMASAAQLWVDTCAIEGFDPAKYDEILWLDKLWLRSAVVCALWYRSADDKYASLAKVRFDANEVIITM